MRRSLRVNIADVTARLKRGTGKCGASMALSGRLGARCLAVFAAVMGALGLASCPYGLWLLQGPKRLMPRSVALQGLAIVVSEHWKEKHRLLHYAALTGLLLAVQRPLGAQSA